MCSNYFVKRKIISIYNFDGPGLRKSQLDSNKYNSIKDRIIHIIPNYSIVGLLLRHSDNYKVIYSKKKSILAHSILSWEVDATSFKSSKLSESSKILDDSVILWMDKYSDDEIITIHSIFDFVFDMLR